MKRLTGSGEDCNSGGGASYPSHVLVSGQPNTTTSTRKKRQPSGPSRGGMEEGPMAFHGNKQKGNGKWEDSRVLHLWLDKINNYQGFESTPREEKVSLRWPKATLHCPGKSDRKGSESGWAPQHDQAHCCSWSDSTRTPNTILPWELPTIERTPATGNGRKEKDQEIEDFVAKSKGCSDLEDVGQWSSTHPEELFQRQTEKQSKHL